MITASQSLAGARFAGARARDFEEVTRSDRSCGVARAAGVILLTALAGCAEAPRPRPAPADAALREAAAQPAVTSPEPTAVDLRRPALPHQGQGFGPEILEPPVVDDAVVARVGDVEIRKSHLFDRLAQSDPERAREGIGLIILDAFVAAYARRHGIRVDAERIEREAAAEEESLRQVLAREWSGRISLEDYIERQNGMSLADYRRVIRVDRARLRYRGLVFRYVPMLEERVELRALWHRDRDVVADVAARVREGADFASLARRLSDHPSKEDGGRLPPLSRGFESPITEAAFGLDPGELSDVLEIESEDGVRYVLLYCLARMPARDAPFADVREEIEKGLVERPITRAEQEAFVERWAKVEPELDSDRSPR